MFARFDDDDIVAELDGRYAAEHPDYRSALHAEQEKRRQKRVG